MRRTKGIVLVLTLLILVSGNSVVNADKSKQKNYDQARWDEIHFKPAITNATNKQCLSCHQEILDHSPREISPAGLKTSDTQAWYQTLNTYSGEQSTFHQRHLNSDYAQKVMDLKCNTCHQGNDLREETSGSSKTAQNDLTMRKMVDPYVCVMCHGQFNAQKMGIPESWYKSSQLFGDSCLTCHASIKTERHQNVSFLKVDAIETAGKEDSDVCFGCHGGRAWYNISFPYSSHSWPGWRDAPRGAKSRYTTTSQK